jgi:diguanylate cyclase (GGDEF)-like protein
MNGALRYSGVRPAPVVNSHRGFLWGHPASHRPTGFLSTVPRLLTSREAFDDVARSLLSGATPLRHAAMLVAELDDFDGLAKKAGGRAADGVATSISRLLVALLRGDDVVLTQPDGRFFLLLPGNSGEEGRQVGERLATAVRTYGLAVADHAVVDRLSLSIGVAAMPDHGTTVAVLYPVANAACARVGAQGGDGASLAPLSHHEVLHRPLSIDRFAGRTDELTSLVRSIDDAVSGRPRVVAVLGESGLGTAMLLRQLEPQVRLRGGAMITATSSQTSVREPYAVWASILRGLHRLPAAPQSAWRELHKLVPSLGPRTPGEAAGSQYRLLEELFTYLRTASIARPLMLVLDEMQWADGTSWDALEHIMGQLDTERILICLTCRNEREFAEAAERRQILKRHQQYHELVLARLTRDEVKQWLSAAFHRQEIGREFLAFIYRHTEGNPFFLSQLVSALVEQGALWHSGQRWEWSPVSELRLPSGIAALIAQRLSRFSASSQTILSTAALLGRDFDVRLVVDSGAGSEPAVRLAMSEAVAAGLVRPRSDRKAGGYGFTHDRVAAVLIDMIPRDALRELHGRVAHALVGRGDRTAGEIAVHYNEARATGMAYEYARKAAVEAEHLYAISAARAYLEIAVHNSASPAELAEVRVHLIHLSEIGGRYDEVEELCDLTIEWFDGQGDSKRTLSLRRMRERARMEQGQPARVTLAALNSLGDQARELGYDQERVAVLTLASQTYGRLGEGRMAEQVASEAVQMAEPLGERGLLADAMLRLGVCLFTDAPTRSRETVTRAFALYESIGDIRGQARCQNVIGIASQYEGRLPEARTAYTLAVSMAKVAGMPDIGGASTVNLGILLQKQGEFDRARELFAEAMTSFSSVKNSEFQLLALFNMAHCERELGAWESAAELYSTTSPLADRIGHGDVEIGSLAGAGLCFLELGKLDRARAAAAEVHERLDRRPEWFQGREIAEALIVRVAALDGNSDLALSRFESALNSAESMDVYPAVWLTLTCAPALKQLDDARVRLSITRYASTVEKLGYDELTRRYAVLAGK